jgi:uncharacterized protein YqeY
MIRDDIKAAQIEAMKAKDTARLGAIRLILSTLKNRDIELRTVKPAVDPGSSPGAGDDVMVMEVLGKMAKQRRESIEMFEKGGRAELAAAETAELAVIESFLPKQMSEEQAKAEIGAIVTEVGATSVKDMGAVMALVKARLQGQIDMSKASGLVKAALG